MSVLTDRVLALLPDARLHREVDDDKELMVFGPPGCLAGETLIDTRQGQIPIGDLAGSFFDVSSIGPGGRCYSLAFGFKKGVAQLYRVVTSEGEFLATGDHRVLAAKRGLVRWQGISSTCPGDGLLESATFPLRSTEELDLSTHRGDGLHLSRRLRGSMGRYSNAGVLCGELVRRGEVDVRAFALPLVDARARNHCYSPEDDLACRSVRIRFYLSGDRPSRLGSIPPGKRLDYLLGDPLRAFGVSRFEDWYRASQLFLDAYSLAQEELERDRWTPLHSLVAPCPPSRCARVISIQPEKHGDYYDMSVLSGWPIYEAAGFWHHNTGKSSSLIKLLEAHLRAGLPPDQILVNAFTRNATAELKRRLTAGYGLTDREMPWVRTIHSSCFQLLRLRSEQVMNIAMLRDFGEASGYAFQGVLSQRSLDDPYAVGAIVTFGDWCYTAEELRRALMLSIPEAVRRLRRRNPTEREWGEIEAQDFHAAYAGWKRDSGVHDFSDMLERVLQERLRPPVNWLFLDETQDMTPAQWRVIEAWSVEAQRVFTFSDDDQSIFSWAGADPSELWKRPGHQLVLSHSYRLPSAVHAEAQRIISRVSERVPKDFEPHRTGGSVSRVFDWSELPEREGSQLLLVRNRAPYADHARAHLMSHGVPFHDRTSAGGGVPDPDSPRGRALAVLMALHQGKLVRGASLRNLVRQVYPEDWPVDQIKWGQSYGLIDLGRAGATQRLLNEMAEDPLSAIRMERYEREYLARLLKDRGPAALLEKPSLQLATIHGVKGEEAAHVVVSTAMTRRTRSEYRIDPDGENRVFYVAATRAQDTLTWIVDGEGFDLPAREKERER